jgi:hypothetical protein
MTDAALANTGAALPTHTEEFRPLRPRHSQARSPRPHRPCPGHPLMRRPALKLITWRRRRSISSSELSRVRGDIGVRPVQRRNLDPTQTLAR